MDILPATYIGSPRHMHEYAQDTPTEIRLYGGPDLFITFTCNTALSEIKEELAHSQSPTDCHDLIARVFKDLLREANYDINILQHIVKTNKPRLPEDQRMVYEAVMKLIAEGNGVILFIDDPGGTGKTFLINFILAEIRSERHIALAVASSGIASTLLDGGHTAHSALQLPLNSAQIDIPI
ncbi:hypothetical protein AVEN_234263-1 [Araneus ventricosus]|uniref:ATP-dependent DNA helicase n=1 Tax=Araneus ventricosus TaxID=182803 RepID=A0A4Y2A7W3_ARAVE|nr:hypothetical protein AVEN_234263-1 [Araneus ventricosus]